MDLKKLGTIIHTKREEVGIPPSVLAEKTGIRRPTLWIYERGENPKTGKPSRPSKDKLERLAAVLHMSKEETEELLALADYKATGELLSTLSDVPPAQQWGELLLSNIANLPLQTASKPAPAITEINGTVYYAHDGYLEAFDAKTGNRLWSSSAPGDPHDEVVHEDDTFPMNTTRTEEDECIIREELNKALSALQEYVSTHANPIRSGRILNMVLIEGCSLEETAKAVGCSAAVAGKVVRSAQHYVRERLGHQRQALSHKTRRVEKQKELVRT